MSGATKAALERGQELPLTVIEMSGVSIAPPLPTHINERRLDAIAADIADFKRMYEFEA